MFWVGETLICALIFSAADLRNNGESERRQERGRRPPPPAVAAEALDRGHGAARKLAAAEVVDRRAKLQEFFVKPQEDSTRQAGRPQKAVAGDGRSRQRQEPAAMQKKPAAGPDVSLAAAFQAR